MSRLHHLLMVAAVVVILVCTQPKGAHAAVPSRAMMNNTWVYDDPSKTIYIYIPEPMTFTVAKARCEAFGATLLSSLDSIAGGESNWIGLQRSASAPDEEIYFVSGTSVDVAQFAVRLDNTTFEPLEQCYYSVFGATPVRRANCNATHGAVCERPLAARPESEWHRVDDAFEFIIVPFKQDHSQVATRCGNFFGASPLFINNATVANDIILPAMLAEPLVDPDNEGIFTGADQAADPVIYQHDSFFTGLLGSNAIFTEGTGVTAASVPALRRRSTTTVQYFNVSNAALLRFGCARPIRRVSSFTIAGGEQIVVGSGRDVTITITDGIRESSAQYFITANTTNNVLISPNVITFAQCLSSCGPSQLSRIVKVHGFTAGPVTLRLTAMSNLELSRRPPTLVITVIDPPSITFSPAGPHSLYVGETIEVTATLSVPYDAVSLAAFFLPPKVPANDPAVNFGPIVFDHGTTTTIVNITAIRTASSSPYFYVVVPSSPNGNVFKAPPAITVTVVAAATMALTPTPSAVIYDGGFSTKGAVTMLPNKNLRRSTTVTLSHNCSRAIFSLSTTTWVFAAGAPSSQSVDVFSSAIHGKQMVCEITFSLSDTYAINIPPPHIVTVRAQTTMQLIYFPTTMIRGATEPAMIRIPWFWPSSGTMSVSITASTSPSVSCGPFVFSPSALEVWSTCTAGNGAATAGRRTISYAFTPSSGTVGNSFRPAARQPIVFVTMFTAGSGRLMHLMPRDGLFNNAFQGVPKEFILWTRVENWEVMASTSTFAVTTTTPGQCTRSRTSLTGGTDFTRFFTTFTVHCNTASETITVDPGTDTGSFLQDNLDYQIGWNVTANRFEVAVTEPPIREVRAGSSVTIFISIPQRIANQSSVTVTAATSNSALSVSPGSYVITSDADLQTSLPFVVTAQPSFTVASADVVLQQSSTDGTYKGPSFAIYTAAYTIHDVRPLSLVDPAPSLKPNYNASFSVTASFATAPGGSFTVALDVVSGFNTRMITITPETRVLTDAVLSASFVVSAPFLSPGSFALRARCVACAKNISTTDLVINVREMTLLSAEAATTGGFTTLGVPASVNVFPVGDISGVNSVVTVTPGASVTASAGPHTVTSVANASLTLTPTADGTHVITFTPVSSTQFINSNFYLPISVFSPWGLRVGMVTPQPMVVGKQYSVGLTAGQMPFGTLIATNDANSTSSGFDRNFTLGVSPRSVTGFTSASLSTIVNLEPRLPVRQFLNFTLAATGTSFVPWASSPSRFWVVPRMNVAISGIPVSMIAGPLNTRIVYIHAGTPPRGVPRVTFSVTVSGFNAANLTTNVSTFDRMWGQRGTSIPVLLTGLGDANVTITVTPSSTEWYTGFVSEVIEVNRLQVVSVSADFTTLYGVKDAARVTLVSESLMGSSGRTLIATPVANVSNVAELSPAQHTFVFEDSDGATKAFNVSALDVYAAPSHGEAVRLSFSFGGTQALLFSTNRALELTFMPHHNLSMTATNRNPIIFSGNENRIAFPVSVTMAPKATRILNVTLACRIVSGAVGSNCSVSKSFHIFDTVSPTQTTVEITTFGESNVSLTATVNVGASNATEFFPYNGAEINLTAVNVLPTRISVVDNIRFVPVGKSVVVNVTTFSEQLTSPPETLDVVWAFAPGTGGVTSMPPSLSFVNTTAGGWQTFTFTPSIVEALAPQNASLLFSVVGPARFSRMPTPNFVNLTVVAPKDISATVFSRNLFLWSKDNSGYVNITVPRPNNTGFSVVNMTTTCNSTVVTLINSTAAFTTSKLFHQIFVGSSNTSEGWVQCDLSFFGPLEFEYRNLVVSFVFVVHAQQEASTANTRQLYIGETGQLSVALNANYHLCEPGTTVIVDANFTNNASIAPLQFRWTAGVQTPLNVTQNFITSKAVISIVEFSVSGTCPAVNITIPSVAVTVFPPDEIVVYNLPRFIFINEPFSLLIGIANTVPIASTTNTTLDITFQGAQNSLAINGPTVQPISANRWTLSVLPNGPLNYSVLLTGRAASASGRLSVVALGVRALVFARERYLQENATEIPRVQAPIIASNLSHVARGFVLGDEGQSFQTETFSVNVTFPLSPAPVVLNLNISFNATFLRLMSTTGSVANGQTITYHFETRNIVSGKTTIDFIFSQSVNLYEAPLNGTINVLRQKEILLAGPMPSVLRVGAVNGRIISVRVASLPTMPTGAARVRLTATASHPSVTFSPPFVEWVNGDAQLIKTFNVSSTTVVSGSVSLFFTVDTVEFIVTSSLTSRSIRTLPLGTVYISDVAQRIFIGQSMIVRVALDHPPLDVPLVIEPSMQVTSMLKIEKLDGTSGSVVTWAANSTNTTQQLECFGAIASSGQEPFNFVPLSREFSGEFVCLGRTGCTTQIIPTAPVEALEECASSSCPSVIMYVNETRPLTVRLPTCFNESRVTVRPSFDDFPDALDFQPAEAFWDCSQPRSDFQFTMRARAGSVPGADPTNRPALVYIESREDAGSLPKSTFGALRINVEVRARQRVNLALGSNISYHKPVNLTVEPLRFPAKGTLQVRLEEVTLPGDQPLLSMSPVSGVSWSIQQGTPTPQAITIVPRDTVNQIDRSQIELRVRIINGSDEFFLGEGTNVFSFANFTLRRTPTITIMAPAGVREFFVGIEYEVRISLSETPDTPFLLNLDSLAATPTTPGVAARKLTFLSSLGVPSTGGFVRVEAPSTTGSFRFRAEFADNYTLLYSFDTGQKYSEVLNTNFTMAIVQPLIYPDVAELQSQIKAEQYVTQKNAQKLTFRIRTPPTGGNFDVDLRWNSADGRDPPILVKTNPWLTQGGVMTKVFDFYRNEPTLDDVVPGTVSIVFTSAPPQFRTTPILLGSVRFLKLFSVQNPVVSEFVIYVGQAVNIPITVDGVPPLSDRVREYRVQLSDRSGLTTITPNITVGMTFSNSTELTQFFTVAADRGRHGNTSLLLLHSNSPDSFDSRKNVGFRLAILPLNTVALSRPDPRNPAVHLAVTAVEVFKGRDNSAVLRVMVPRSSVTLFMTITSTHSSVTVEQELSTSAPVFSLPPSDVMQVRFFRVIGLLSADEVASAAPGIDSVDASPLTFAPDGSAAPGGSVVGLRITLTGSSEIQGDAFFAVTVRRLHGFLSANVPTTFYSGELNGRRFTIRPAVPENITLAVSLSCEGAIVRPTTLQWVEANFPQEVFIAADTPQACFLTVTQAPGRLKPTFETDALKQVVVVSAAPEITLTYMLNEEVTDTLSAKELRERGITFRLKTQSRMLLSTENITVGVGEDSSIILNSTHSTLTAPTGFIANLLRFNGSVTWTVNEATRDRIDVVIKPLPQYTNFEDERIGIRITQRATINGTSPNPRADTVFLTITGDPPPPPDEVEKKVMEFFVFSSAGISGLMSMSSAAQAGKVLTISSLMRCPSDQWITAQDDLPFYVVLIPARLGTNAELGAYAGAVVSNFAVVLFLALCHYGACRLLKYLRGADVDMHEVYGSLGFPALIWFPLMLMFQTTFISAGRVTLYSSVATFKVIGSVAFIFFAFGVPAAVARIVSKSDDLEFVRPQRKTWAQWLFERGTYHHPTNPTWVQRYALPIAAYRGESRWFAGVEIAVLVILSVVTATDPKTHSHCITRSVIAFIVFVVQLIAMLLVQPYSSKFENFFFMGAYAAQVVAMALVVDATVNEKNSEAAIQRVLIAFGSALIIKGILDWWGALRQGMQMCAVLDPHSARSFAQARGLSGEDAKSAAGDDGELQEGLLAAPDTSAIDSSRAKGGQGSRRGLIMNAEEAVAKTRQFAPLATATVFTPMRDPVTGETRGSRRVLTGFQRAIDPAVAAYDEHLLAQRDYSHIDIDFDQI